MNDKKVGYKARLPEEVDGDGFDIFSMEAPDYTTMLMSTYLQMVVNECRRENTRHVEDPGTGESNVEQFRYTEVILITSNFMVPFITTTRRSWMLMVVILCLWRPLEGL